MINTKDFVKTLGGRPAYVFGLGLSGLSTVRALKAGGADVMAWDDDESKRAAAMDAGAELRPWEDADFGAIACLIPAPGVPLHFPEPHGIVRKAREANVEIIGDLEILHRCKHGRRVIGITGTNGKSTTTALTGHILNACGVKAVVGGNIGKAVLDLKLPPKDGALVLEVSSFQMDLCPTFAPDVAVLLNITPDHIDRHGTLEEYIRAKTNMLRGQGGIAIIGADDEHCLKIAEDLRAAGGRRVIPISGSKKIEGGVWCEETVLTDGQEEPPVSVGDVSFTALPGVHNRQNAAAAYAAVRSLGINPARIHDAMKTYPGLPHRQQLVRVINGVAYVNDSKATNADAAGKALACYRNIYWIVGGRMKEGGLNGLEAYMERVKHAFLIGESMEGFAEWLKNLGVAHNFSKTLNFAVSEAHVMAQGARGQPGGGGIVLLSPACASYDQFRNFEHRGESFVELARALPEEGAA